MKKGEGYELKTTNNTEIVEFRFTSIGEKGNNMMKSDKNIIQPESSNIQEMTDEEKADTAYITRNSYHKEKFRKSLKLYTRIKIQAFAGTHPDLNAKDLLVEIIKSYNPKLPSVVLLEMTEFILAEWEKNQAKNKAMQLA